ncbi:MAG TPA: hypothetical protein VJJ79_01845 [Candidatus Nanoarchaeia archaeon]|nr:hypothetical protein [Candidatus Nanoarchaeia archaeon]
MTKYCLAIGTDVVDREPSKYLTRQGFMRNNDDFLYPLVRDANGSVVVSKDIDTLEAVALEYFREHTDVTVLVAREYFRAARLFEIPFSGRHLVSNDIVAIYLPGDEPKAL